MSAELEFESFQKKRILYLQVCRRDFQSHEEALRAAVLYSHFRQEWRKPETSPFGVRDDDASPEARLQESPQSYQA